MTDTRHQTIGILGSGQLGRMSAIAAAELGLKTVIFAPDENSPASEIASQTIVASYDDEVALKKFAESVDVISYEFENIPVETVQLLNQWTHVYPDASLLEVSQHRKNEKSFLNENGLPTAEWSIVTNAKDLSAAVNEMPGSDFILKTTRFGYDGKGQIRLSEKDDSVASWTSLNTDEAILEQCIDFEYEISIIVARDKNGQSVFYGPSKNIHQDGILKYSLIPANISETVKLSALNYTKQIADAINLRGVMAIEFFVTKDEQVLANEIAPRTHNSGHWTVDACAISQFENHIRTVAGYPAGATDPHSSALMINLIGDDVKHLDDYYQHDNACIHIYGKGEIKDGRKMGHVTILNPDPDYLSKLEL